MTTPSSLQPPASSLPRKVGVFLFLLLPALLAGCQCLQPDPEPLTAQAAVMADDTSRADFDLPARDWPAQTVGYHQPCIDHPTLYLDQPEIRTASQDGCFETWDRASAKAALTGPLIFLGETIALPVSMICQKPWDLQCGRGHLPEPRIAPVLPGPTSNMTDREPFAPLPYPLDLDPAEPELPQPPCQPAP